MVRPERFEGKKIAHRKSGKNTGRCFRVQDKLNTEEHRINESADKIRLETKIKRGTGTRDQDSIKVKVYGSDPAEVVGKLETTVDLLTETADDVRAIQPGETDGEAE